MAFRAHISIHLGTLFMLLVYAGTDLADVTNVISVNIAGSNPPLTASAMVYHAVELNDFRVTWNNCPSEMGLSLAPKLLTGSQSVLIGYVTCRIPCTTPPTGFCQTCSVTASVDTSVGGLDSDSTWAFNVQPCPP